MQALGTVIESILRRKKLWKPYRQQLLVEEWDRIAGKEIAAATCARRMEKNILWVTVKDSIWAYHLSLLKPRLIDKMNEFAGERMVRDIFFQVGSLEKKENEL